MSIFSTTNICCDPRNSDIWNILGPLANQKLYKQAAEAKIQNIALLRVFVVDIDSHMMTKTCSYTITCQSDSESYDQGKYLDTYFG